MTNKWMNRQGERRTSEMIMRNTYQQYNKQYYLLVEGESDEKFFSNIINTSTCKVVNLCGRSKVENFISKENNRGKNCYVGVVDADFNNITHKIKPICNVFQIDVHDVEMLILSQTNGYRKIYSEYADINLIEKAEIRFEKCFIDKIMSAAYKIGVLKLVVQSNSFNEINMKDLPYYDFIDSDFNVDIEILIDRIKRKYSKETLLEKYTEIMDKNYDKLQVCCGHDITNIMALAFTDKEREGWGYGTNNFLTKERIESTLRAIYNYIKFKTTNVYNELVQWQTSRGINLLNIESTLNVT